MVVVYILICAVPMIVLCMALIKIAKKRPDYGTEPDNRPFDGTIVIGS